MNEFKFQRARAGAWTRYLNVPLLLWFASDVPMPADKQLLVLSASITLACNVVFHLHLELTRRHLIGSYLMLVVDQFTICLSLYATGVTISPFLLYFPLLPFSAYFVDFNKRAAILYGVSSVLMLAGAYAVWWFRSPPVITWDPRAYPVWVWTVCALQMLSLAAYSFLATETNPLVEELAQRERVLLKQAHKAELGTSLSMIAHELRNPLTSLQFSLERIDAAALAPGADPKFQKAARVAGEELARISRMVEDVLAYARERRGRMLLADHEPAVLVERALDFLRMKWGRHHRKFAVEAALAGAPVVRCDADAMHQVLVNILDNAIQHAVPDRPLRIEIRHALRAGRVSLVVRDNASGIPAARVARLFDGFVTDREEGTGLGMMISRQLLEDQSGGIEVSSLEGVGTTVVLDLPAGGTDAIAVAETDPVPAPEPRPAPGAGRPETPPG